MTERELVERCRRGDRVAQHELYLRTSTKLYHLLLRLTGCREDASDLTQETYIRGFSRIGQFNGNCAIETWLFRIAVNEAMKLLRHNKMAKAKIKSLMVEDCVKSTGEQNVARLDVKEALARLNYADRLILLLRYNGGLDYRAIARILGCAVGTVGSRLNRANGRLRQELGDGYAPREEEA